MQHSAQLIRNNTQHPTTAAVQIASRSSSVATSDNTPPGFDRLRTYGASQGATGGGWGGVIGMIGTHDVLGACIFFGRYFYGLFGLPMQRRT
jgi:hypothetical protein